MSRKWSIKPFDPVAATRDEWAAYHVFRRLRNQEDTPDEPVSPDEVREQDMKRPDINGINDRHVAWIDGEIVAYGEMWVPKAGTPEYESNKHLGYGFGAVLQRARGQGVGSALLQLEAEFMRLDDQRIMNMYAHEPDGIRFLENIGAECKQIERESRLYLKDVNWDQIQRWRSALEERSPGTKIEFHTDPMDDDLLPEYCAARTEMMNLMPWDDLDHGDIVITPEDEKETYERMKFSNSERHTIFTREPDGRITAITDVVWRPHRPGILEQWFTGVHPGARGRGLGKAIKAEMVHLMNERYNGLEWIGTGNAATNDAMLAINNRLGFKEHRRYNAFQMDREAALQVIAERSSLWDSW